MANVPGPRTKPTVKPMVSMNTKNLNSWEVKLNIVQIVIVIGLVTGSMACAFYLGFFSGRSAGVELALQSSMANLSKMPIVDEESDVQVSDEIISEVYAKLNESHSFDSAKPKQLPQVASIENSGENNTLTNPESSIEDLAIPEVPGKALESAVNDDVEFLGGATRKKSASTTLGSLLELSANDSKKVTQIEKLPSHETKQVVKDMSKVADEEAPAKEELVKNTSVWTDRHEKVLPIVKEEKEKVARLHNVKKNRVVEKSKPKPLIPERVKESNSRQSSRNIRRYVRSSISKGWYAQVAAPKELADADGLAGRLKGSGFSVMIEMARVRGQEYYRVLVGPESSRVLANRLLSQLKRESYLKGDPFIKLVR